MKQSKRNTIIYWIFTLWLCLGMVSTGLVQILHLENETAFIIHLGYPMYFLTIIGVWKLLGVVAVLVPGYPLVKEWAYAGFFFMMSGAILSHLFMASPWTEIFPAILLFSLTIISWFFRPVNRRITHLNQ